MGDDKVKESPAEVFDTVAEVNTVIHSLEDMLGPRFEAIDGKFGGLVEKLAEMDARNERRFEAIEKNLAEVDARNERRFEAIDGRFGVLEEGLVAMGKKLAAMDTKYERRFEAIDGRFGILEEKLNAVNANNEVRFDLVEQKFKSQDFKIEQCVTSAANKLMIMLLLIAGSIIASLLYVG